MLCYLNNCNISKDLFKEHIDLQISRIQELINYSINLKDSGDKMKVLNRVKELVTIYKNEVERFEKSKEDQLEVELKNRLTKLKEIHRFISKSKKSKSKKSKSKSKKSKSKKSKSKKSKKSKSKKSKKSTF